MMEFVDLFESTPNDWEEFKFEDMNLDGIYLELEDQDIFTDHQSMPNIPEVRTFYCQPFLCLTQYEGT